jgi:hypothetical protein
VREGSLERELGFLGFHQDNMGGVAPVSNNL